MSVSVFGCLRESVRFVCISVYLPTTMWICVCFYMFCVSRFAGLPSLKFSLFNIGYQEQKNCVDVLPTQRFTINKIIYFDRFSRVFLILMYVFANFQEKVRNFGLELHYKFLWELLVFREIAKSFLHKFLVIVELIENYPFRLPFHLIFKC